MDAKEFLSGAFRMDQQVQSKLEQIEALRSLAEKMTIRITRDPVSRTPDPSGMENTVIRILEAEEELNRRIDALVEMKMRIGRVIEQVRDPTLRLILEKRYLLFQRWDEISIDLDFTQRWILMKHQDALNAVQEILDREETESEAGSCL